MGPSGLCRGPITPKLVGPEILFSALVILSQRYPLFTGPALLPAAHQPSPPHAGLLASFHPQSSNKTPAPGTCLALLPQPQSLPVCHCTVRRHQDILSPAGGRCCEDSSLAWSRELLGAACPGCWLQGAFLPSVIHSQPGMYLL